MKTSLLPFSVLGLALAVTACSHQSAENTKTPAATTGITQQTPVSVAKTSDFLPLADGTVIVSSETQGLFAINSANEGAEAMLNGQYETLRNIDGKHFAALNAKTNALVVFQQTEDQPKALTQIDNLTFKLDGFCFYQSTQDSNLYAYLLDGDGHVAQYLLGEQGNMLAKPVAVKTFFVGPDNNSCAANHLTGKLYLNEATAGLWQYPAAPEASLERQLVAAVEPHGSLPEDFSELVWLDEANNVLAGIREDSTEIAILDLKNGTHQTVNVDNADTELTRIKALNGKVQAFDASTDTILTLALNTQAMQNIPVSATASVSASVQTEAVDAFGDAADDPAIWYNSVAPQASLILGTNKKLGLMIYNLEGKEVQRVENGHVNNVDLRYNYKLNGKTVDIAAASNRSNNAVSLYTIDQQSGNVAALTDIPTDLEDIYGLCMQETHGEYSVWVNDKDGTYAQYILKGDSAEAGRRFTLPSQPEGCVADDKANVLYAGEEDAGVWRIDLNDADSEPEMIMGVSEQLVGDVEGIAIAHARNDDEQDLLVISSQGDHSYVLAEMTPPYKIVGKFQVSLNSKTGIDGTAETDGIEVSTRNYGGEFAGGIMVIQDGYNLMPVKPQNFKYVSWQAIVDATLPTKTAESAK